MRRVCFTLHVKPERIDEYRRRHAAVWPAMLAALSESGWHNYSLFLAPDGLLVGYVETDNFELALEQMKNTEVNTLWQNEMASFFLEMGDSKADDNMMQLEEVFHLE